MTNLSYNTTIEKRKNVAYQRPRVLIIVREFPSNIWSLRILVTRVLACTELELCLSDYWNYRGRVYSSSVEHSPTCNHCANSSRLEILMSSEFIFIRWWIGCPWCPPGSVAQHYQCTEGCDQFAEWPMVSKCSRYSYSSWGIWCV